MAIAAANCVSAYETRVPELGYILESSLMACEFGKRQASEQPHPVLSGSAGSARVSP